MYYIKQRFRTKPTSLRRPNGLECKSRILIRDLHRLTTPPTRSSIGHKLRMTAFFQTTKPEDCGFDRGAYGKETMILQKSRLSRTQSSGDVVALLFCKDNTIEGGIERNVLYQNRISIFGSRSPCKENTGSTIYSDITYIMKRTSILRNDIQSPS